MKRVFLIILDSFGIGAAPDAPMFGDAGTDTLAACVRSGAWYAPNLEAAGIGNIDGVTVLPASAKPHAAVARMREVSAGKDTTVGHWEIAGVVSKTALPTYPEGFPEKVLSAFSAATGRGILCNRPYSGTQVIRDFGDEHLRTGKLIVYTSADSVFQIAAHEDVVPPETLYAYCHAARGILTGENAVGRVIARPFTGTTGSYTRTANRRDFSIQAPKPTLLDDIVAAGRDVIAVGKISDIFAGRGITETLHSHTNEEGMRLTMQVAERDFHGLCFTNLVDYDMLYGHRRDPQGYARAIATFDAWLPGFLSRLGEDDVLMVTADHGCDPSYTVTTDHTREHTPWMIFGRGIRPVNLGTLNGFCDIAATAADLLGVGYRGVGNSHAAELLTKA